MNSRESGGTQFSQFGGGRPVWLVTFADLVALLIAFFVMMFATQKVDAGKWEAITEALSRRLNPDQTVMIARPLADRNVERLSPERAINLDYLEAIVRDKTRIQPELAGLSIQRYEDRVVIALPAELLFEPGKAGAKIKARPILFALAGTLGLIGNRIEVIGHADPRPLGKSHFSSNWELSIARSVTVANELRRAGYDRPLTPSGYGASTYRELPAGLAKSERSAVSRRVDIVIWPTRGLR